MTPKFKEGDSVFIDSINGNVSYSGKEGFLVSNAIYSGKEGFLVSNAIPLAKCYVYWVFIPEFPFPTQVLNPTVKDLAWAIREEYLEPLNETKV